MYQGIINRLVGWMKGRTQVTRRWDQLFVSENLTIDEKAFYRTIQFIQDCALLLFVRNTVGSSPSFLSPLRNYRQLLFRPIYIKLIPFGYKRIMRVTESNLLFIRHAESAYNLQTLRYVSKKNIVYDWEHLSKDHQYLAELKYNYKMLDCGITEQGMNECRQTREILQQYQPDVILVSPLNRALKTCSEVFPEPTCPVIVEPILSEGLRSSGDFSGCLSDKKTSYPLYNFQQVQQSGEFWFIKNDSEQNQAKYQTIIEDNKQKGYQQTIKAIFAYMIQTWIFETPTNLRQRTDKLKLLLKNYSQRYLRIAVVSHFNIIRFILAEKFNERDEPDHCHIANCEIRTASVDQL